MLIINAHILTMEEQVVKNGYILIKDGIIGKIGDMIDCPDEADVIDAAGGYAIPGMIDAHCHLGLFEDGLGFEGDDGNESSNPVMPQLRVIDAINPLDRCFEEAARAGVTTAVVSPGSANPIGGQIAAVKTYGRHIDNMIVKEPVAMKMAFGENPKTIYHEKNQTPVTRMATASLIREALFKTEKYIDDEKDFCFQSEMLIPVLKGELPVHAHAHRADDIFTALRIGKEFGMKVKIVHATDGTLIAEELAQDNVEVMVGPSLCDRSKPELKNLSFQTPAALSQAGVKLALITDHPVIPIQYLPLCGALAIREGMDAMEALKAVTIYAAQIAGIDEQVGSLKAGKDADICIFDRFPLDFYAKPVQIIINGKKIY